MKPFDICKYLPLELGPGIHASRALYAPAPTYPDAVWRANLINGSVAVVAAVNDQGGVDDVKMVRSSERKFEQIVIDTVKQWEFAPATKDGDGCADECGNNLRDAVKRLPDTNSWPGCDIARSARWFEGLQVAHYG